MKGAASKGWWANLYNCLGGHVERGEDILSAAHRELREEAGLEADLWLAGTVSVDSGEPGICLFVMLGENPRGEIRSTDEGQVEWVDRARIPELRVVEDLPVLLDALASIQRGDTAFSARSYYDPSGKLTVVFAK